MHWCALGKHAILAVCALRRMCLVPHPSFCVGAPAGADSGVTPPQSVSQPLGPGSPRRARCRLAGSVHWPLPPSLTPFRPFDPCGTLFQGAATTWRAAGSLAQPCAGAGAAGQPTPGPRPHLAFPSPRLLPPTSLSSSSHPQASGLGLAWASPALASRMYGDNWQRSRFGATAAAPPGCTRGRH